MTTASNQPESRIVRSRVPWLTDLTTVGASGVGALVVWLVVSVLGRVTPVVPIGDEPRPVTIWAVVGSALIGSLFGIVVLRLLERLTTRAVLTWTVMAGVFTFFSLIAPLGATTAAGMGVLAVLHLVVAAITIVGARRARKKFGEAS